MDFKSKYIDKATMKKFKIELSYESVIPLLGIYPKEIKSVLYFSDCKTHFPPPQIWEENGGASYSLNVAYLAHCSGEEGSSGSGFFFPIFLL